MGTSIHQRLKDTLIARFQSLELGSRLPSTRSLAAEFGAAYLTINRILRDLEHDGYIVRKAKQGTFLASRERPVTSTYDHAPGASGTVVFIHPDFYSFHYWSHLRRAEAAAVKGGYRFAEFKIQSGKVYDRALAFIKSLSDVIGIIVLPLPGSLSTKALDQFNHLGVPVVFVSDTLPDLSRRNLFSVDADYHAVGSLAVGTLFDLGHRQLGYLQNEPGRSPLMRQGMAAELARRNLPASTLKYLSSGIKAWGDSREVAYELAKRVVDEGSITAVILDSLNGALGVQRALWERRLSAPDFLSILAIGNSNGLEAFLTPPVTTIDWDRNEETRLAFTAIAGTWPGDTHHINLMPRLFPLASTGPLTR